MLRKSLSILLLLLLTGALYPAPVQEALRGIDAEQVRAHLEFLSGDLLEGRAPGTRGGSIASAYIASQLARAGVEPVRGSYYQSVPLIGWRAQPRRTSLSFNSGQRRATLRYPDDAMLWLESGADSAAAR